jgi:hypothetical protein
VDNASILLLIIVIETSLVVGFVCGLWVMSRLARSKREEDEKRHRLWLAEGRRAAHQQAGVTVQTLGSLRAARSEDAGRAQQRSAV